jgi:hypothetical protein
VGLSRFKISIYRNLLDYYYFFNINSREIAAGVGDRLNIDLIFKGFFVICREGYGPIGYLA